MACIEFQVVQIMLNIAWAIIYYPVLTQNPGVGTYNATY